jgi:rubrerythrin
MNIRRVYEYALQREHEGKRFFEGNAGRMSHAAASGIFQRLAGEEQKHINFIESLLRSLDKDDADTTALTALAAEEEDRFAQRAASEMIDQTVIESMIPDVAILRMAYLIERDFAEFYEGASQQAEGEAKTALAALARWERGHERLFKELHDRVMQEYAEMPWGG